MERGNVPGVLRASRDRHGSVLAGSLTVRNSLASDSDVRPRSRMSNTDSMHSVASRSTVGIASGATTLSIGAP